MSFGTSELGSSDAELGNIELAGLGSGTSPLIQSVTQTLTFTETTVRHLIRARVLSQTLTFSQTTVEVDTHYKLNQTLTFTQTASIHYSVRHLTVLQIVPFVQSNSYNQTVAHHVSQTLVLIDHLTRQFPENVLQLLTLTHTVSGGRERDFNQSLIFTQTVTISNALHQFVHQNLALAQTFHRSQTLHTSQIIAIASRTGVDFTYQQECDQGTLGDTALADMTLATDCGSGGIDSDSDTIVFSQTLHLQRVYHRTINDRLTLTDHITLGNFLRVRHLNDTLTFYNGYYPRTIPIGSSGGIATGSGSSSGNTTVLIPVAIGTVIKAMLTMVSDFGAIILPPASFDDSISQNNKVKISRTMTRKAFTYVKSSDRVVLKYEFFLEKLKALELRRFAIANTDTIVTLTNWKGEVYIGKLSNNPVEFTSHGRLALAFESVIVALEFQGVKING